MSKTNTSADQSNISSAMKSTEATQNVQLVADAERKESPGVMSEPALETSSHASVDSTRRIDPGNGEVTTVSSKAQLKNASLDSQAARDSSTSSVTSSATGSLLLPSSKAGSQKRDRSSFRKGKWTVEEEEYTSRIIHYFNIGLLTLPEGATLRSYLADKLNCDPMRITKKYAGASCLGRRACHFRDRPQPSLAEIQLTKAELDHLETRFRMRVEEAVTGNPSGSPNFLPHLSQPHNQLLLPNPVPSTPMPNWLAQFAVNAPQNALMNAMAAAPNTLLNAFASQQTPQVTTVSAQQNPLTNVVAAPSFNNQINQASSPWILPTGQNPIPSLQNVSGNANISQSSVDAVMASLAFAQAAAALAPAISQLAAINLQQCQRQLTSASPEQTPPRADASDLRSTFEQHIKALATTSQLTSQPKVPVLPTPQVRAPQSQTSRIEGLKLGAEAKLMPPQVPPQVEHLRIKSPADNPAAKPASVVAPSVANSRSKEEEDDGSILLGFLSSLRRSYEDALKEKDRLDNVPNAATLTALSLNLQAARAGYVTGEPTPARAQTVTDSSSSQQQDSSIEDSDWNSDKKTDPSSSEDSDKEATAHYSKGPPRKRMKQRKVED